MNNKTEELPLNPDKWQTYKEQSKDYPGLEKLFYLPSEAITAKADSVAYYIDTKDELIYAIYQKSFFDPNIEMSDGSYGTNVNKMYTVQVEYNEARNQLIENGRFFGANAEYHKDEINILEKIGLASSKELEGISKKTVEEMAPYLENFGKPEEVISTSQALTAAAAERQLG